MFSSSNAQNGRATRGLATWHFRAAEWSRAISRSVLPLSERLSRRLGWGEPGWVVALKRLDGWGTTSDARRLWSVRFLEGRSNRR